MRIAIFITCLNDSGDDRACLPQVRGFVKTFERSDATWSATSDIEPTRVEGVHGPRRLTILIGD